MVHDRRQFQLAYTPSVLATAVTTAREIVFQSNLAHTFPPPPPPENIYIICSIRACTQALLSSEFSFSQHSLSSHGHGIRRRILLCLGHGFRVVHPSRERIRTGAHRKAAARNAHAQRPQCAAEPSISGAYAAGRSLVTGLRLLCVASRFTRPFYFLFRLCDNMGSTTANHNKPNVYGQQKVGRIAPPWRDVRLTGSLWWLPIICFHQGGTAMNLEYRIAARALLLYSSLSPVVDTLKSKLHPRSKVSLNG